MAKKALFHNISGNSFNVLLPDGSYRTFDQGILATDDEDPMFDYLVDWAGQRMEITVVIDGEERQSGMLVCSECGRLIDDREMEREAAEADHAKQYHETKDTGEQTASRRTRGRRR